MNRIASAIRLVRKVTFAGLLAATCWAGSTNLASATEYPPAGFRYEYAIRHVMRQVPYKVKEVRYDHCGKPYEVEVTRYRTVQVPVRVRVLVPCH